MALLQDGEVMIEQQAKETVVVITVQGGKLMMLQVVRL
jgi:hypothetical protein